jgi:hypothetical protein
MQWRRPHGITETPWNAHTPMRAPCVRAARGSQGTTGRARSLLLEAARGLQGSQLVEEWLWLALSVVEEPLSTAEPGHGR